MNTITVYVGFFFSDFSDAESALEWIRKQDGYINKSIHYIVDCKSDVEID